MCPDGTQCRQGSPDAPDATRCGVLVQDAQDAQDAGSRLGESGRNTTGSDAGHLFADVIGCLKVSYHLVFSNELELFTTILYYCISLIIIITG